MIDYSCEYVQQCISAQLGTDEIRNKIHKQRSWGSVLLDTYKQRKEIHNVSLEGRTLVGMSGQCL